MAFMVPRVDYRLDQLRLENASGSPIRVQVYYPVPAPIDPAPAAIICQPFNNPPAFAEPLALELVRSGFAVLTFNWQGEAPEENRQTIRTGLMAVAREDVAAAVDYLRSPRVDGAIDGSRIMVAGHSVGGTLALESALADLAIAATAVIGMEAEVTPDEPPNLLWAVGLYDEFRPVGQMRKVMAASADSTAPDGTTIGSHADGTARRLAVSPTTDHFIELQDSRIHREVVSWFRESAGIPGEAPAPREARRLQLHTGAWLALLLALILSARWAVQRWPFMARLDVAFAAAVLIMVTSIVSNHVHIQCDAVLLMLAFTVFGGFITRQGREDLDATGRRFARIAAMVFATVMLTLVANSAVILATTPRYFLALPEFVLTFPLIWIQNYLLLYPRQFLFSHYGPDGVTIHLWLYALFIVELVSPGVVIRTATALPGRLRKKKTTTAAAPPRKLPPAALTLFAILMIALGAILTLRLQQGFLTAESGRAALRFIVRYGIIPLAIFTLLRRCLGRKLATRG
jgi:dienelactone hydrolase